MFYLIHLISRFRLTGLVAASVYAMLSVIYVPAQAQVAVGVNEALAAPIAPLGAITVPDVNMLGILDRTGPNATAWPQITIAAGSATDVPAPFMANKLKLQQLGKALFWDMQVGGDGIQSCASCHFHAGADNRKVNQLSPGLKRAHGGEDPALTFDPDTDHDLLGPNQTLTAAQYSNPNQNIEVVGLPVDELALAAPPVGTGNWTPDEPDGTPGIVGTKAAPAVDVNDVVSSQGVRLGTYEDVSANRVDAATLATDDPGFNTTFTAPSSFTTSRRVEPRNSPTAVNAVFNFRNFWDGRADAFFNGVNPLGFRDPNARVKVYSSSGGLGDEKLRVPFSSLASQAVGPIESDFEMVFAGRPHRDLGQKLLAAGVIPLDGQMVSCTDSLLGGLTNCATPGTTNLGLTIPGNSYDEMIRAIFDQRFWGDGAGHNVCLKGNGTFGAVADGVGGNPTDCSSYDYTLMEWNFSLFFGLSVQAYEAILTTEQTIVDLLVGGVATGIVTNERRRANGRLIATSGPIDVGVGLTPGVGLPLEGCIALARLGNNAAADAVATALCTQHYAQFIHPNATAGANADQTATPVTPGAPIGGCTTQSDTTAVNGIINDGAPWCGTGTLADTVAALTAIDRGMGRFFAGATGCGICHFNPEFTGATVAALTGFGAAPLPPLPPGQLARIAPELPMERMIAFNGAAAVYDSGFYNLGVRPTPEDLSLGDQIGGVPLAFTKLAELIEATPALDPPFVNPPYDPDKIADIAAELAVDATTGLNELLIPTSPADLTPRPFTLTVACGPGLVGNGNVNGNGGLNGRAARDAGGANNNPNAQCVPTVIPNERLLRNGAFKAQGLRNVKLTGPYMHNGSKMTLQQVVNFYETEGHFPNLNFNNLDAGLRIFDLGAADTASLLELMETGLTDWRLVHEEGKFDHPEICVPNGHDGVTGQTILASIPAVGSSGSANPLTTFEDIINDTTADHEHTLADPCTMPGIQIAGLSDIDVNPVPAVTSLSPSFATAGDLDFTLTITGTGFVANSVVRWNGSDRTTTYVSDTVLTADIPAADIATAGTANVSVFNPAPGGGTSGDAAFTINP